MPRDRHQDAYDANRILWDRRTAIHLESKFYDVKGFVKSRDSLKSLERKALGDLQGKKVLHLQCHFGQDTISMAALGAEAIGIDLSDAAISAAKELAEKCEVSAQFYASNVYDIDALDLGEFDIVFTSYGTICWLPDLSEWAAIIRRHLRAGGRFVMIDFHPVLQMIDWESGDVCFPYFPHGDAIIEENEQSYVDDMEMIDLPSYFWQHSTSELLQSLIDHELVLVRFAEYDRSPYDCFPHMEAQEDGQYKYSKTKVDLPHLFEVQCITR